MLRVKAVICRLKRRMAAEDDEERKGKDEAGREDWKRRFEGNRGQILKKSVGSIIGMLQVDRGIAFSIPVWMKNFKNLPYFNSY